MKAIVEDGEFWCECSEPDCAEREYAALRKRDGELLLSRRHAPVRLA
jgi:hypothetical protein